MASVRLCSRPPNPRFFCRGPARAWSAHQDDRPQGPHRRCVQEEGLDIFAYVATSDMLPQRAGSTVRAVYAFLRECLYAVGRTWRYHPSCSLSSPLPPVLNTLLFSLFLPLSKTKISILSQRVNHIHESHSRLAARAHSAVQGMLNSGHVAAAQWESIRTTVHVLLLDPSHIY